jgi:hypothetical protein
VPSRLILCKIQKTNDEKNENVPNRGVAAALGLDRNQVRMLAFDPMLVDGLRDCQMKSLLSENAYRRSRRVSSYFLPDFEARI